MPSDFPFRRPERDSATMMAIRIKTTAERLTARLKRLGLRLTISRSASAANFCLMAAAMVIYPELMPLTVVLGGYLAMRRAIWVGGTPLGSDPAPWKGARALFLGTEQHGWGTVWLPAEDVRGHIAVMGGDQDQRLQFSMDMLANALAWGGGACVLDATGHADTPASVGDLAMRFGRQEDVRVIDLAVLPTGKSRNGFCSNSINPFVQTDPAQVAGMVFHLAKRHLVGSENRRLGGLLLRAVVRILCWRRDTAGAGLDPKILADSLGIDGLVQMLDQEASADLPDEARHEVDRYLKALPEWRYTDVEPGEAARARHAILADAIIAGLAPLTGPYAHIFCSPVPDVELQDVVENSRLLVIRLPGEMTSSQQTSDMAVLFASMLRVTAGNCLAAGADQTSVSGEAWLPNPHIRHSATSFLCIINGVEHCSRSAALLSSIARGCDFVLCWLSPSQQSIETAAGRPSANDLLASSRTRIFLPGDPAVTGQAEICPEKAGATLLEPEEMLVDAPRGVVALRRLRLPDIQHGHHYVAPLLLPVWPSAT